MSYCQNCADKEREVEKLKLDLEGTRNDYGSVYAGMCKAQDEGRRLRAALKGLLQVIETDDLIKALGGS